MLKLLPLVLCLYTATAFARVQPAEGSKLNYVMVGFTADAVPGTARYKLQVAKGNYTDEQQFGKHIIIDTLLADNRSITELPTFATQYTWRISYLNSKKKVSSKTPLYHFNLCALSVSGSTVKEMSLTSLSLLNAFCTSTRC